MTTGLDHSCYNGHVCHNGHPDVADIRPMSDIDHGREHGPRATRVDRGDTDHRRHPLLQLTVCHRSVNVTSLHFIQWRRSSSSVRIRSVSLIPLSVNSKSVPSA